MSQVQNWVKESLIKFRNDTPVDFLEAVPPISIIYGSLYGFLYGSYMDPIWILYESLHGFLYGSYIDPYMDPIWILYGTVALTVR